MRVVKVLSGLAVTTWMLVTAPAAFAAPPPNDDFAHAAPLGDAPVLISGTVTDASREPGEPYHGAQTVWYVFRPSRTARVAFHVTNAPAMEPRVSVYRGTTVSMLNPLPVTRGPLPARVAFEAVAGESYHVAIAHYDCLLSSENPIPDCEEGGSTFDLRLESAPPPRNDAFANAKAIRIPGEFAGDLLNATGEPGEYEHHSHSVWYRFRSRRTGTLTLDFAVGGYDCKMRLYTGRELWALKVVKVGGSAYADGPTEPMRLTVRRGVLYHLALNCEEMERSTYALTVSDGSIRGKGITLTVDPDQTVSRVRARGLKLTVSAKRRAHVRIDVRVSRRTARRLRLGSRVLARTERVLDYSDTKRAVIRLTAAARRALAGVGHVTVTVRLEILRSDAPNRVLSVPVTL
jgi:hypothetical protein